MISTHTNARTHAHAHARTRARTHEFDWLQDAGKDRIEFDLMYFYPVFYPILVNFQDSTTVYYVNLKKNKFYGDWGLGQALYRL